VKRVVPAAASRFEHINGLPSGSSREFAFHRDLFFHLVAKCGALFSLWRRYIREILHMKDHPVPAARRLRMTVGIGREPELRARSGSI
jgi:hypothetical protein